MEQLSRVLPIGGAAHRALAGGLSTHPQPVGLRSLALPADEPAAAGCTTGQLPSLARIRKRSSFMVEDEIGEHDLASRCGHRTGATAACDQCCQFVEENDLPRFSCSLVNLGKRRRGPSRADVEGARTSGNHSEKRAAQVHLQVINSANARSFGEPQASVGACDRERWLKRATQHSTFW